MLYNIRKLLGLPDEVELEEDRVLEQEDHREQGEQQNGFAVRQQIVRTYF